MKKNKIYFLALLIIGLLFNSCDTNTEEFKAVSSSDSFDSTSGSIIVDSESKKISKILNKIQ